MGRSGDGPVSWHNGLQITRAANTAIILGELVLHGLDLATALGRPWPIDPAHASVILAGYLPIMGTAVNPVAAAGHTGRYGLELRGAANVVVTFIDGVYGFEAPSEVPVDCQLSADPVTYLLVGTGRMSQWTAIAQGLISAGGAHPELAVAFGGLFEFP